VLQNVYISLPYNVAAKTAGLGRNDEITSLSTYVYCKVEPTVEGLEVRWD